jgi:hypothetical protein
MAVRAHFRVVLGRGHARPVRRVDEVLVTQPRRAWHSIAWSEGAKGWFRVEPAVAQPAPPQIRT